MDDKLTIDLVLLPGLLCDERLWRDPVALLDGAIRPMIADLTLDDSIAGMAARVLAVAPPRFALAGLSMGGYVAMQIMRQAPERVSHLALFDTLAAPDDEARRAKRMQGIESIRLGRFIGVSRGLLGSLLAPDNLGTPLAQEVQAMSERVGAEAYLRQQTAILGRIDSRPSLGAIAVPTLVGVGALDVMTPPERARTIADAIEGAMLVEFAGCGHLPTMEAPQAVAEAMRAWLKR